MALALDEAVSKATGGGLTVLPHPQHAQGAQLLAMCQAHREYSSHHPLFDRARFDAALGQGPVAALAALIDDIRRFRAIPH